MSPRPAGRSSARRSSLADGFTLTGPSDPPDPAFHAYRPDLADCTLAGRVIASHYAEPLDRTLSVAATLRQGPSQDSEAIANLPASTPFAMLDNSRGWAWGYAGDERRVGYVPADSFGAG